MKKKIAVVSLILAMFIFIIQYKSVLEIIKKQVTGFNSPLKDQDLKNQNNVIDHNTPEEISNNRNNSCNMDDIISKSPYETAMTYQEIIESIGLLVQNKCDNNSYFFSELDIDNIKLGLYRIGYLFMDIDGNGIDELLIGANPTLMSNKQAGYIYKIYTTIDNLTVRVVDSSSDSPYYLCKNGIIGHRYSMDAFSVCYTFNTFKNGTLNTIESVVSRIESDEGKNQTIWLYSDMPQSDDLICDVKNYITIDESMAQSIITKYEMTIPEFIPIVNKTIEDYIEQNINTCDASGITISNDETSIICLCDIDRDGTLNAIVVDYSKFNKDNVVPIYLTTYGKGDDVLYADALALSHAGWREYYIIEIEDKSYLINYTPPHESQGTWHCSYEVFSFDTLGNRVMYDSLYENNEEKIKDFEKKAKYYLDNSTLLISTWNSELRYYHE